jgi:hypothetical protein
MKQHELILLTPYTYPGQNPLQLGNEDMASWLNGFSALWHPAALWGAVKAPRYDAPYDYEEPKEGHVYAVPESPPLILPDDWNERVKNAGAVAFRATPDRATTLANMMEALKSRGFIPDGFAALAELPADKAAPFFGVGMGHLLLASLSEAMEHENLLETEAFWDDVQQAAAALAGMTYTPVHQAERSAEGSEAYPTNEFPSDYEEFPQAPANGGEAPSEMSEQPAPESDPPAWEQDNPDFAGSGMESPQETTPQPEAEPVEPWYGHLQSAAGKLLSAREVLYPVVIHLVDLHLLDENRLADFKPVAFDLDIPTNLVASGKLLEKLAAEQPELLNNIRQRIGDEQLEVCGGCYVEREDALLPFDSQIWNLLKGQEVSRTILGSDIRVFARRRFGFHPQLPLLLTSTGLTKALLMSFDEGGVPSYQGCVVSWPSPDGKQIEAMVRTPHPADNPQTYFNLGHYLFKTTREDHAATLGFLHNEAPTIVPADNQTEKKVCSTVWHRDILELSKLAPVVGQWTTLSRYLGEVMAGEYSPTLSADEFHYDYLSERTNAHLAGPVSGFARHVRLRRRLDTCWTLAALNRSLGGPDPQLDDKLNGLENEIEQAAPIVEGEQIVAHVASLVDVETKIAGVLTERLQVRAAPDQPGTMILNPCSFIRRVALELEGATAPLPVAGHVKACQLDGDKMKVVVEVPALGFAWIPKSGPPGTPQTARMRLADKTIVRNEFFEAEVDPQSGGLRAIRDHKTRTNRLGQRLVFNPGSAMHASSVQVTLAGPALGEIVSEGTILGEQNQVLAKFRQRFRAWLGRPVLDMRIEIYPEQPPAGYPWHAYFGARFAWRDERAMLLRGVNGSGAITTHNRPQTPDYLEVRLGRQSTSLFPGGLPFHQRHDARMVDIILVPEGEQTHTFDIGIGLDREQPMQTALGMITPVPAVATSKGAPHIGATGWLFHLDAPNLLLSRMVPGGLERNEEGTPHKSNAITARLLECASHSGQAEFRCVKNPTRAVVLDAKGSYLVEANVSGDAVFLEVSPSDLVQVQVEFS